MECSMGTNASATKLAVLVLPIAVFSTAISVATAQTRAPGNVVQRQDGMKAMANAAKSINTMFKDTSP
jgi:cytochrome c556